MLPVGRPCPGSLHPGHFLFKGKPLGVKIIQEDRGCYNYFGQQVIVAEKLYIMDEEVKYCLAEQPADEGKDHRQDESVPGFTVVFKNEFLLQQKIEHHTDGVGDGM